MRSRLVGFVFALVAIVAFGQFVASAQQRYRPHGEGFPRFTAGKPQPLENGESTLVRDELTMRCAAFIVVNGVSGVLPDVPCGP
jgi:hypothetical protein